MTIFLGSTRLTQALLLMQGGYWNSHFNVSDYHLTNEVQSLFVNASATNLSLSIRYQLGSVWRQTNSIDISGVENPDHVAGVIFEALNATDHGVVLSVVYNPVLTGQTSLSWREFHVTFSDHYASRFYSLSPSQPVPLLTLVTLVNGHHDTAAYAPVLVTRMLAANNFPLFEDKTYRGINPGGKFTCYKQGLGYVPFSYYTASRLDVNAMVRLSFFTKAHFALSLF